jgi:hypothetical protein
MALNKQSDSKRRRGKGQTLVEFAAIFPILLILMFGIIEFGRIFQAWVTLQNSARTAARYATTGQFNEDAYPIDASGAADDIDSIVPCVFDDERGNAQEMFSVEYTDPTLSGDTGVMIYDGLEGLYATWYQGEDCLPNDPNHQEKREDLARILSIFDEAYVGAAGLAVATRGTNLSPATYQGPPVGDTWETHGGETFENFVNTVPWYAIWDRNLPGSGGEAFSRHPGFETPSYFDVMLCSVRGAINDTADATTGDIASDKRHYAAITDSRFATVLEADDSSVGADARYAPACLLNEDRFDDSIGVSNTGRPWIDPGGPGDGITLVVTFNHPLVTPLGLSPYLQLQARRTAVNESFRAADAVTTLPFPSTAPGGESPIVPTTTGPDPSDDPTLEVVPSCGINNEYVFEITNNSFQDMETAVQIRIYNDTDAIIQTDQLDPIPAGLTATKTYAIAVSPIRFEVDQPNGIDVVTLIDLDCIPEPTVPPVFDCDLIEIPTALGQPLYGMAGPDFQVQFINQNVMPTRLLEVQLNWATIPAYPGMFPWQMQMARSTYWVNPAGASTDPLVVNQLTQGFFPGATPVLLSGVTNQWSITFANGPVRLSQFLSNYAFDGTTFVFENPDDGSTCEFVLDIPEPTITPTLDPNAEQPTATPTPACQPGMLEVNFQSFEIFGVVRVQITNRRNVVATMTGFDINWIQRDSNSNLYLRRMRAGGSNPEIGTLIWESGATGQDNSPPTTASSGGGEGVWGLNYNFPPNSTTNLWLDYDGGVGSSSLQTVYLASLADFNGSSFEFIMPQCAANAGGPGSITVEQVTPPVQSTPPPTNTNAPPPTQPNWTNTPRPPTSIPPTAGPPTPIPPTNPPPTAAPTDAPPVTIDFGGGGGGAD